MTRVIALTGPAGCGKTEIAKYLVDSRRGAKRYALATPLKEIIRRAFDLTEAQLYGTQAEKETVDPRYGVSPRWLMTRIGTEGVRAVLGDNFWVRQTIEMIRRDRPALAVVEDCRFLSEAAGLRLVHDLNVNIWRIENPFAEVTADPSHQSEAEWRRIQEDHILCIPSWGLKYMYAAVDELMR